MTKFLDYKFTDNSGNEVEMSKFAGKNILVVNTASFCGYTQQYEGLEDLYRKHSDSLEIIAFPCNQFDNQEPNSDAEIKEFCKRYNISFTLAAKIDVNGEKEHPIYKYLKEASGENHNIEWNFVKFLVLKDGTVTRHGPDFAPHEFNKVIES